MPERQCAGCKQLKERSEMIKITKTPENIVINPDNFTFGRSVYLCYNENCIENVLKKNRLDKILKTSISNELKGQLLDELRNN